MHKCCKKFDVHNTISKQEKAAPQSESYRLGRIPTAIASPALSLSVGGLATDVIVPHRRIRESHRSHLSNRDVVGL